MKKYLKKIMPIVISSLLLYTNVFAKDIIINGFTQYEDVKQIDDTYFMKHDTLLDALGVDYKFDIGSQQLTIDDNDVEIIITRGSNIATVNGNPIDMGVTPLENIEDGVNKSLYIPVEFVATSLSADIYETDNIINIYMEKTNSIKPNKRGVSSETVVYTYDEAVDKAIQRSSEIRKTKNTTENLEFQKKLLKETINTIPFYGVALSNDYIELLSSNIALENSIELEDDNIKMYEDIIEFSVLSSVIDIEVTKDKIDLLESSINTLQKIYDNNTVKYELGLVSESVLLSSLNDLNTAKSNLTTLEMSLQNKKYNLNKLMGVNLNEDNYIDFDLELEPLELEIDSYAKNASNNSTVVKNLKGQTESLEYSYDNHLATGSPHYYEEKEKKLRELQNANIDIGEKIRSHELKIKQSYMNLKQLEQSQKVLQLEYEKAVEDYEKAVLNYDLGLITSLEVDMAKSNVESKHNAIRENCFNYESLKFAILHPDLLV